MKLIKLSDLFDIKYGVNLALNSLDIDKKGIPFVSRTSENNGVSAHVKLIDKVFPNPAYTISVSGGGSVCEAFLQKEPYYSGRDLFYIVPKLELTESEMLLYCSFIRANKYRYSYGRQANKTLANIKVPSLIEVRNLLPKFRVKELGKKPYHYERVSLNDRQWKWFRLSDYFSMWVGKYYYKDEYIKGKTPYITASDNNNGVMCKISIPAIFCKNSITIGKVGCVAYYQSQNFCATSDVTILEPKKEDILNEYIGLFLITLINKENYRWNYGRQIRLNGCKKLKIKLPTSTLGCPDWKFMENYIKSLPYSCNLK